MPQSIITGPLPSHATETTLSKVIIKLLRAKSSGYVSAIIGLRAYVISLFFNFSFSFHNMIISYASNKALHLLNGFMLTP